MSAGQMENYASYLSLKFFIEFLIEKNGNVVPVEVKSKNSASASLNSFIDEYSPRLAYKLIAGNVGQVDGKITLPHYMVMFL